MPDLNVTFVLPSGGARTAEVPDDVSVRDLLAELTSLLKLPTIGPDGRPMAYRIDSKSLGRELKENESLADAAIPENDRLMLTADITAGRGMSVAETPRMRRLRGDYELMVELASRSDLISFRASSTHPNLPPERYIVTFKCKSVVDVDRQGNPKFNEHHQVEIYLHNQYIGRSEGASVIFRTEQGDPLEIFTTRPDTLWGATFMVLAPEHLLVSQVTSPECGPAVEAYIQQATRQTDIQRESTDKEKTGVFTGGYALNPVNGKRIPIWIAAYVLMTYGTGAIMAVPSHDERDFQFAIKFGLPILPVIERPDRMAKSFTYPGSMLDGFDEALRVEQIPFFSRNGGFYVTLTKEKISRYIEWASFL